MEDPFAPAVKTPITNGGIYPPPEKLPVYGNNHVQNGFFNDPATKGVFAPAVMRTDHIDYTSKPHFAYADEKIPSRPVFTYADEKIPQPRSTPSLHSSNDEPRYVAMLEPPTPKPEEPKTMNALQNTAATPPTPPIQSQAPQWKRTDSTPPPPKLNYNTSLPTANAAMSQQIQILNQPQSPEGPNTQQSVDSDPDKRYSVVIGGLKGSFVSNGNNGNGNGVNNGTSPGVSLSGSDNPRVSASIQVTAGIYDTMQGKLSNAPRQNSSASMPGYTFNNISS